MLHSGITVHGLLASFLAFGDVETLQYSPWMASWPSLQDFQESMPILWLERLQRLHDQCGDPTTRVDNAKKSAYVIRPAIEGGWCDMTGRSECSEKGLLQRQKQKLDADWSIVLKAFPNRTLPEYTYFWLVVNTRSFYFDALGGQIPESRDDRMVLCPFVDYFNHNDHGVSCFWATVCLLSAD